MENTADRREDSAHRPVQDLTKLRARFDAVVFDLFGTLVPNAPGNPYRRSLSRTAELVGADVGRFHELWTTSDCATRRFTGQFGTQANCIRHVCELMGLSPDDESVRLAALEREEFAWRLMEGSQEALGVLTSLKEGGLKLGLMSSCAPDTPRLFRRTPIAPLFDVTLFSSEAGINKPDPKFYEMAHTKLGVRACRCLYVGDGHRGELTGARNAGMTAVLICRPGEEEIVFARDEARNWNGPRTKELAQLPYLFER